MKRLLLRILARIALSPHRYGWPISNAANRTYFFIYRSRK